MCGDVGEVSAAFVVFPTLWLDIIVIMSAIVDCEYMFSLVEVVVVFMEEFSSIWSFNK